MTRYSKFIAAVIGALATAAGIELDEATLAQISAVVTALLVWAIPNWD